MESGADLAAGADAMTERDGRGALGAIAMELERPLKWDPAKDVFVDDAAANALRSRPQRDDWKKLARS